MTTLGGSAPRVGLSKPASRRRWHRRRSGPFTQILRSQQYGHSSMTRQHLIAPCRSPPTDRRSTAHGRVRSLRWCNVPHRFRAMATAGFRNDDSSDERKAKRWRSCMGKTRVSVQAPRCAAAPIAAQQLRRNNHGASRRWPRTHATKDARRSKFSGGMKRRPAGRRFFLLRRRSDTESIIGVAAIALNPHIQTRRSKPGCRRRVIRRPRLGRARPRGKIRVDFPASR